VGEYHLVNGKEKQDLGRIVERLDQAEKDRSNMHGDIKFIKENLFNPKEGLWAETKLNSQFRENSKKWQTISGTAIFGILGKFIYDFFNR
jgi:hypothetical protein